MEGGGGGSIRASRMLNCGNVGLKRGTAVVGVFAQPGSQPALDQILALLGKPAVEVLSHHRLGGLIEIEHQAYPGEDLGIADRLHIPHSTMVRLLTCARLSRRELREGVN